MAILIIFLVLPAIFLFFLRRKQRNTVRTPPGPKGLPIVGNLFQLDNSNVQRHLWQLSKQHGPVMSLRLGSKPTLVVSSAKMAREVLKTQDLDFCGRPPLTGMRKLSYNGLDLAFASYDDYWREMRKICVVHLFNFNRVQSFRPIREDEVSRMIRKISKLASDSQSVNLSEEMMALTNSAICRVAFGKRFEDDGSEAKRIDDLILETQALFAAFFFSDYFPVVGWIVDRLSGLLSRLEKNFQEFDAFYQKIIDQHLDHKREKPEHDNFLDVLLQMQKDRSSKIQLTFNHIKAILMNVFIGGTDTSAATVVWAMSFLMKNPGAMERAQEEVRKFVEQKGFVNEDDLQQLPYLKCVVKETMRLQPTLPLLIPRETIHKCTLGGYDIPANSLVYVNAWAVGRDPEAWTNPSVFYPERFLDSSVDLKGQDYELVPFGSGRRSCPGMYIGITNVEISLANLLYKFNWEMPAAMKREDIDTDNVLPGVAVHKKDHLCLMAKNYI